MIKEGKFGVQEAVSLTTITISTKVFFTSPAFLTTFVGTAGWQMTIISCLTAMIAFYFVYLLMKRFPGNDIVKIFHIALGPVVGLIFSLIFAAAFLQGAATSLREFCDVMKVYVYPLTPPSILIGALVIAVSIAAFLGLETIARVSKLTAYIMFAAYLGLLLLSIVNYRLTNIFPFFGYGIDRTLLHGIRRSSAYDEIMVLTVFAGSLQGTKYLKKAGIISLSLSGFIIAIGLFCFTLAFPLQTSQELTAPIYVLARAIKYGNFFQRLDPLFIFLWNYATLITISVLFYCAISIYCKSFHLQDPRPIILPMAILLFTMAILPKDFANVVEGTVQTLREYGWIIFYTIPIITLIVAMIRKKKGTYKNA